MSKTFAAIFAMFVSMTTTTWGAPVHVHGVLPDEGFFTSKTLDSFNSKDIERLIAITRSNPCLYNLINELQNTPAPFRNRAKCEIENSNFKVTFIKGEQLDDPGISITVNFECASGLPLGASSASHWVWNDRADPTNEKCQANTYVKEMRDRYQQRVQLQKALQRR